MKISFSLFVKKENSPAIGVKFNIETDCRPVIGDRVNIMEFLNDEQKINLDVSFLSGTVKSVAWKNVNVGSKINVFTNRIDQINEPYLQVELEQDCP